MITVCTFKPARLPWPVFAVFGRHAFIVINYIDLN